jgi:hypothetical protein
VSLPFELLDADALEVDSAHLDGLRHRLPVVGVRLLHLWVFDERTNDGLIDRWRSVGPVQLLRGGGALGGVGTLLATITGRVGDLIEETIEEVEVKLAAFDYERDEDGRFAVNTILCGDRTWRVALDDLIATTDVVQMDLGGFDGNNQGCTHELGLLIDRVSISRVLLVVGDSTDLVLLRRRLTTSTRQSSRTSSDAPFGMSLRMLATAAATSSSSPSTASSSQTVFSSRFDGGSDEISSTPSASASAVATRTASTVGPSNLTR